MLFVLRPTASKRPWLHWWLVFIMFSHVTFSDNISHISPRALCNRWPNCLFVSSSFRKGPPPPNWTVCLSSRPNKQSEIYNWIFNPKCKDRLCPWWYHLRGRRWVLWIGQSDSGSTFVKIWMWHCLFLWLSRVSLQPVRLWLLTRRFKTKSGIEHQLCDFGKPHWQGMGLGRVCYTHLSL